VKEVTYTPAQLAAREEGKLKHNAACCSQRPSFRIVCGAGNLARGRVAGGSFGPERVSAPVRRRLKALPRGDPGQDWLPHRLCRQFTLGKVSCVELKHAPPEVTYTPAQPATLAEGA
jgi:hypothetical protein